MSIVSNLKTLIDTDITLKEDASTIGPEHVGGRMKEVLEAAANPVGSIIMYHPANLTEFDSSGLGVAQNVLGYAICNGSNGTPDLRGRFIVGYNPSDTDYDTIGETGGAKTVTLTVDQIPSHSHTSGIRSDSQDYVDDNATPNNIGIAGGNAISTGSTGGGQSHENRPPYYTLVYLKRIN